MTVTNVLVCIKRVPGTSGQILLSDDGQSVDARHVGWAVSPHEECAVELATQIASATGGSATVLTVGPADAVEQLRDALAVGCTAAVLVEAENDRFGPADVAASCCSATTPPTPATSRSRCASRTTSSGRC